MRGLADQAEAPHAEANALVRDLYESGRARPRVLLGPVMSVRPYDPGCGSEDSGQVTQAVLVVPDGLGVVFWDTEDLYVLPPGPDRERDARRRFTPVAECPPLLRVQFLPFAADLLDNRARRTIVKYTGVLTRFEQYLARHRATRLGQVTAGHFDRYRAERRAARHRKTVWCEGIVIKQLFKWAKTRKLVAHNPLADVKLDKPPLEPKEGPSLAHAILAAADEPLRSQLAVLAFTGMRAGELQRLRPEDVDPAGGWVHVLRPGAETKTRESRKVPVHPRLRAVLAGLPPARRPWLFTAGASKKYPAGDHHISTKRLNERFTRLVGRLGCRSGGRPGSWSTRCGTSSRRSR